MNKCLDCGTKLKDYRSKRCPKCAHLYLAVTYRTLRVQLGRNVGKLIPSVEARQKMSNKQKLIRGRIASNWQGGITPLMRLIRNSVESKEWRLKVFKRDNHTCQKCQDNTGGNLEAHHKKTFVVILKEFLQEYSQFSPIDDVETLSRLSLSYKPFWDIDNGITFCKKCHKQHPEHEYAMNKMKSLFEMAHIG